MNYCILKHEKIRNDRCEQMNKLSFPIHNSDEGEY